jgi:hypothetical protein
MADVEEARSDQGPESPFHIMAAEKVLKTREKQEMVTTHGHHSLSHM